MCHRYDDYHEPSADLADHVQQDFIELSRINCTQLLLGLLSNHKLQVMGLIPKDLQEIPQKFDCQITRYTLLVSTAF